MLTLTLHGLRWGVPSPSHYTLELPGRSDAVEVFFADDVWLLFLDYGGDISAQAYPSRDAAMAVVREAFKREGMAV